MNHKSKFKDAAAAMMKPVPQSMKDLLEEKHQDKSLKDNGRMHNRANADLHMNDQESNQNDIVRIHVHIRKDLADKVLEAVFQRKRNKGAVKKDASQRAIIEEALEMYFG